MSFENYFPIWDQLQLHQKHLLLDSLSYQTVKKGTILRGSSTDCAGLVLIRSGQLRALVYSEEGREITIYRLFDGDLCLFCAPCVIRSIQFDVTIQAEKDTEFWVIPSEVYQKLMTQSTAVSNYTNELMASRFTEVMSRVEQFMWKSMDKRVAAFLLQEASIEGTYALRITHEMIANHLGFPPGGDHPHTAGFPGCRDGETVPGSGDHSGQGETARPCEITAIPYTVHCLFRVQYRGIFRFSMEKSRQDHFLRCRIFPKPDLIIWEQDA